MNYVRDEVVEMIKGNVLLGLIDKDSELAKVRKTECIEAISKIFILTYAYVPVHPGDFEKYGKKINFLLYATRREMKIYPFVLLANCFISLWIFIKNRPQVIITTGTHTAGPMCIIAKILGSKVIYIETFANRNTKTETGKLLYM